MLSVISDLKNLEKFGSPHADPLSLPLVSIPVYSELLVNFFILVQFRTTSLISQACFSVEVIRFLYCDETFLSTRYFIIRFVMSCCGNFKNYNKSIL